MRRRKQSVVTLSFENERETVRGYFSRLEARSGSAVEKEQSTRAADELGKNLMALCREIAGALLCRYASNEEASVSRRVILDGLVGKIGCEVFQAERLIDLSLELIHVHSYGSYRRNPVELSLLIAQATGQQRDGSLN
jgi:hypothetical protein